MKYDLDEKDAWNLLSSITPEVKDCIELEKSGIMIFCRDKYNPNWEWNKDYFDKLPQVGNDKIRIVFNIYELYKPK